MVLEAKAHLPKAEEKLPPADDCLGLYLRDIGDQQEFEFEVQKHLWQLYQAGKRAAKELASEDEPVSNQREEELAELVDRGAQAGNQLVLSVAKLVVAAVQSRRPGDPVWFLELIGAGNEAAIDCLDGWDPNKGVKFGTYVWTAVVNRVKREIGKGRAETVTSTVYDRVGSAGRIKDCLTQELGREPTLEEIANEMLSVSTSVVEHIFRPGALSLEESVGTDDRCLRDCLTSDEPGPEELVIQRRLKEEVEMKITQLLAKLEERDREVLSLTYGLAGRGELSEADIGQAQGVSRQAINARRRRILKRIEDLLSEKETALFRDFLSC